MPRISLISALSINRVIGMDNQLPWHLPADWENFRRVTAGGVFIQGRVSYQAEDALHSDKRDLVLSRSTELQLGEGAEQVTSLEEALARVANEDEVFILGGASVFEQALPLADYLYLTIVHGIFEGDAYFPVVKWENWRLVRSCRYPQDERHSHALAMNEYSRRNKP